MELDTIRAAITELYEYGNNSPRTTIGTSSETPRHFVEKERQLGQQNGYMTQQIKVNVYLDMQVHWKRGLKQKQVRKRMHTNARLQTTMLQWNNRHISAGSAIT